MSQQFLSKYFKRPGDTNDNTSDAKARPKAAVGGAGSSSGEGPRRSSRAPPASTQASKRKKTAVIASPSDGVKSDDAEWPCSQCTFKNLGSSSTCEMCGKERVMSRNLTPTPTEEVEILSSDSKPGADGKGGGDTADSDDSGSDFENLSSGHRRKRSKKNHPVRDRDVTAASNTSASRSTLGENKEVPAGKTLKRHTTNTDSSGGRTEEVNKESGSTSGGDGETIKTGADSTSEVFGEQAITAEEASSATVSSTCIFDLREDKNRRSAFQAGLAASLRDDENLPIVAAGRGGNDGDRSSRLETPLSDEGSSAEGASATRSSALLSSRKGRDGTASKVKLTPMEQQVVDLKAKHPGVLLLVECGYRYRFFGEDALAAAKVLRIYAHMDHNFQVASVPTFRLAVHLRRLVDAGYKVGVVRQAESAALKAAGLTDTGKKSGTFKRELAAVFSQATWVEGAVEALMPSSFSNNSGGGGGGNGSSSNTEKSAMQGSFRKIDGVWRRIGGWGGKGGKGKEAGETGGKGGSTEDKEQAGEPASEADMDAQLPQVDHQRSEQWLMSVYEEDASPGAASEGEPLSISAALEDLSRSDADGISNKEAEKVRVGLVAVDVRTGKVIHDTFEEGSGQRQELLTRLRHLRPLELLVPGPRLSKATEGTLSRYSESAVNAQGGKRVVRTERLPPEEFCFEAAQASLSKYYGRERKSRSVARGERNDDVDGGNSALTRVLDLSRPAICALGPLMTHLERFGLDRSLASPDLVSFSHSQFMTLDAVTLRDLEVLQCQTDGREAGSLFSILDRTHTAFGRRVLAGWVRQPLLSPEDITARQDAVEELATDPPPVMERLRPILRELKDLDAAIASLHHRRIQPSRLLSLLTTMRKVFGVFHPPTASGTHVQGGGVRSSVLVETLAGIPADMAPVIAQYLGELNSTAAAANDYVQALENGESFCRELTQARQDEEAAKADLDKELQSVRNTLRKPSLQWKTLRTGATSTVEYLVELRKSEAKKLAPSSWMQVSQTKDLARFHTPEVLRLLQELLRARESRNIAARQAWEELMSQVDEASYAGFRTAVHALGMLDALLSLSTVARLPGYVRPNYRLSSQSADYTDDARNGAGAGAGAGAGVSEADEIILRGARHPTVERVLEGGFVPNDVSLRKGECLVVTGPNMGGKSSTVRMVALICIMGQMGSFVPADSADMYCMDGVYTRMGAGDDLAADMSTFMVELWHTSYIIKHATRRSLVVLDELGRGTSTHDGVAIALATLRHMVRDIGCATLFVTHYPQVADLASDKSLSGTVKNAHMSFIEHPVSTEEEVRSTEAGHTGPKRKPESHGVTFLYRLVSGQAHQSYGLNVARSAGIDEDLIELAAKKSAEMRDRNGRHRKAHDESRMTSR